MFENTLGMKSHASNMFTVYPMHDRKEVFSWAASLLLAGTRLFESLTVEHEMQCDVPYLFNH
jgi:uncharacterized membrane protein YgdD (TMEM256/DUF423 family)